MAATGRCEWWELFSELSITLLKTRLLSTWRFALIDGDHQRKKAGPPRLELGMPGSKPGVLPITPRASDVVEMGTL